MNLTRLAVIAMLLPVVQTSLSQSLISRLTTQNYQATYGGGGDLFTPSDLVTDSQLLSGDYDSMVFQDTRDGLIGNDPLRPWGAAVGIDMVQGYVIDGPLHSFSRIRSSGNTNVAANASGEGLATITGVTPGNELRLGFKLAHARQARLSGTVSLNPDGQDLHVGVALERFDGIAWENVFNSLYLPGQEGLFDNWYNLAAGEYRIVSYASGDAFHVDRPMQENAWDYDLEVVPEPATMAALGLGLAALGRRRKRA